MSYRKDTGMTRREFVLDMASGTLGLVIAGPLRAQPQAVPPIVSPGWLAQNLADPRLVVLDIRNSGQYKKGHIPGALNVPVSSWAISKDGLLLELPPEDALRDLIAKTGINAASHVVVVNRVDTDFSRADATRVAWTCAFAGIERTSVLDGGYNRWVRESNPISTEAVNPGSGAYVGKINRTVAVSKSYVLDKIGTSIFVDTRTPEDYFGIGSKPGHIKGSVNLPTPWAFNRDGTFRKEQELRAMAAGVIGADRSREIILYCEVGGFATTWWFLLTRIFGYRNAKVYDGSIEEWVKDPAAPVTAYTWD